MAAPASEAFWHLYYRCEWCPYFDHCREEMHRTDDISRLPNLTSHAKRYLTGPDVRLRSVKDFGKLLKRPDAEAILSNSASLRGKAPRLREQVAALQKDEVRTFGASSLSMPKGENVRVMLTLQTEPVTGQVYTYGLLAYGGRDIVPEQWRRPIVRVAPDDSPTTLVDLKRSLVNDLWSIMEPVDAYNREHAEWSDQKTVQCFSFDSYEPALLRRVLLEMLADGDATTRERALRLFFHFQAPELLASDDHPANESFFPVVILTAVIRSLFALPVETTVRFADAVALLPSARPFRYRDNPRFAFRLSNRLKSDAIFYVWRKGETENLAGIERELQFRLWATSSLINGIREHLDVRPGGSSLFSWPPKFFLPASLEFAHPVLSKLAFLLTYEGMVSYEGIRTRRTRPLEERLLGGDALLAKYLGGEGRALIRAGRPARGRRDLRRRLAEPSAQRRGRRRPAGTDVVQRLRLADAPVLPKQLPLALVSIAHADPPGERGKRLALGLQPTAAMPELRKGRWFFLDRRFTDWTTQRALAELRDSMTRATVLRCMPRQRSLRRQPEASCRWPPSHQPSSRQRRAQVCHRGHHWR